MGFDKEKLEAIELLKDYEKTDSGGCGCCADGSLDDWEEKRAEFFKKYAKPEVKTSG